MKRFTDIEYYKDCMRRQRDYSDYDKYRYYKNTGRAFIVASYPEEYEEEIYRGFSKILHDKYSDCCTEEEVYNRISSFGHLYTGEFIKNNDRGEYLRGTGDIIGNMFFNNLSDILFHELVHKVGFMNFDDSFYHLDDVYLEAGAYNVMANCLEKEVCREIVLGDMVVRSVIADPIYLLQTAFVEQMNQVVGGNLLDKGTIQGRNLLEPKVIDILGQRKYQQYMKELNSILKCETEYWNEFAKVDSSKDDVEILQIRLSRKISKFQDSLMEDLFSKSFVGIFSADDAKDFLECLMNFSDYRVKFKVGDKYTDPHFDKYYNKCKRVLEQKFNTRFEIEDIRDSWSTRFPFVKLDKDALKKLKRDKNIIHAIVETREQNKFLFWRLGKDNDSMKYNKNYIARNYKYFDEADGENR